MLLFQEDTNTKAANGNEIVKLNEKDDSSKWKKLVFENLFPTELTSSNKDNKVDVEKKVIKQSKTKFCNKQTNKTQH